MAKYRKKPVVVEAFCWTGDMVKIDDPVWIIEALKKPWGKSGSARFVYDSEKNTYIEIFTLEGVHEANQGDYIVQGTHGELYPCKPNIFEDTYEELENNYGVR